MRNGAHRTNVWIEHFTDFHPDIIALAKAVASGLPLGVMMARSELMTWEPGAHASTFGGNPVCLAAALETVRLLENEYVSNAAKIGTYMKPRLQQFMNTHRVVGDVRGLGLMLGIDIVKDRRKQGRTPSCGTRLSSNASSADFSFLEPELRQIRLSPPLLIDEEQSDCALRILSECISAATA